MASRGTLEAGLAKLDIFNPFAAPVFHAKTLSSTMDVSKAIAGSGIAVNNVATGNGTVVCADFQENGRGRNTGRKWDSGRMESLLFTLRLCFPGGAFPVALTIKAGLAAALAIEDFAPSLSGMAMVKWPNDIMLPVPVSGMGGKPVYRKAAGILAEAQNADVHIGIGVNILQTRFPQELCEKATSIALASQTQIEAAQRFVLLEKMLVRLHQWLNNSGANESWRSEIEARLYRHGEKVLFAEGSTDSPKMLEGTVSGIGAGGELLIVPEGSGKERAVVCGELRLA
jgi:BirA family biotin operon repressor/biotin-[acetyl-CoA-carboxylase] ligase